MGDNPSADSPYAQSNDQLTRDQLISIYTELCNNIRATDEVSFKLLAAVPFASGVGAGVLTILDKSNLLNSVYAVMGLSLLGAVITLGLFRWELRNIKKCNWLIARAARVEQRLLPQGEHNLQYSGIAKEEHLCAARLDEVGISTIFRKPWKTHAEKLRWQELTLKAKLSSIISLPWGWGKTEAEKLIYSAAIIAWLIPMAIVLIPLISTLFA
jgi:hypothetical protein